MEGFKLICCKCKSENILEKSSINEISCTKDKVQYGEGIQRKCIDCDNEDLIIYKTWSE